MAFDPLQWWTYSLYDLNIQFFKEYDQTNKMPQPGMAQKWFRDKMNDIIERMNDDDQFNPSWEEVVSLLSTEFFRIHGYNVGDWDRHHPLSQEEEKAIEDETEQEEGEAAGMESLEATHSLDLVLEYDGDPVPELTVTLWANVSLGADITDVNGTVGFELMEEPGDLNIVGISAQFTYNGVDYEQPLTGTIEPDGELEIVIEITAATVSGANLNKFTQERLTKALDDWGLEGNDRDVYKQWAEKDTGNESNIKYFWHRCIKEFLDETKFITDETEFKWSKNSKNWLFLQQRYHEQSSLFIENPYEESFILVSKYRGDREIDEPWNEEHLVYKNSYVILPQQSKELITEGSTYTWEKSNIYRFWVISGYAVNEDLPTWMREHLKDTGTLGFNLVDYFQQNTRKLKAYMERQTMVLWNVQEERDMDYYDFSGDMHITPAGVEAYPEIPSRLTPYGKKVDYSMLWGLLFLVLIGIGVVVYIRSKKGRRK